MTEEEMKSRISELEDSIKAKDATINSLESQRSNQNAYITKLESKARTLESNINNVKTAANNTQELPTEVVDYFKKKRREDYMEQAYEEIRQTVSEEVFTLLKPEVDSFVKAYMTDANTSVKYVVDAFHLLLGKAYSNPNHPINKKKESEATKIAQPVNTVPDINQINAQVSRMQTRMMTNDDQQMKTPAPIEGPKVANTKEALNGFKTRLLNGGYDNTKFE